MIATLKRKRGFWRDDGWHVSCLGRVSVAHSLYGLSFRGAAAATQRKDEVVMILKYQVDPSQGRGGARLFYCGALVLLGWVASASSPALASPQSSADSIGHVDKRDLPSGAEMLAKDSKVVRPQYLDCMAQAGSDLPKQKVCVDAEYAYQDGELNRWYKQVMAGLSETDRAYLRKSQRDWVKYIYGKEDGCPLAGNASIVQQVDAQQCRIHATIGRSQLLREPLNVASDLAVQKSPRTPRRFVAPQYFDSEAPDVNGLITLQPKNYEGEVQATLHARVGACEEVRALACLVESLTVEMDGKIYPLQPAPPRILYDRNTRENRMAVTLTLTDLNKDGHLDLMLWTGQDGNYGSASFNFYLFDPKAHRFVENTALKAAVDGHEVSYIENNRFMLWYRSGPCKRGEKLVEIRGTRMVTVRKRDYDTCKGDKPTDAAFFK